MKSNGAVTILRWGLAFVFFYAAIAALIWPDRWAGYIPFWITFIVPAHLFLAAFSFYQLVLAAFLFWGKKLVGSSLLTTITFTLIVIFNFRQMGIVFQDIGLAFAALALFEMSRNDNHNNHEQFE